jgi:hypothetical protein
VPLAFATDGSWCKITAIEGFCPVINQRNRPSSNPIRREQQYHRQQHDCYQKKKTFISQFMALFSLRSSGETLRCFGSKLYANLSSNLFFQGLHHAKSLFVKRLP